jgi:bleomycin hydrolase
MNKIICIAIMVFSLGCKEQKKECKNFKVIKQKKLDKVVINKKENKIIVKTQTKKIEKIKIVGKKVRHYVLKRDPKGKNITFYEKYVKDIVLKEIIDEQKKIDKIENEKTSKIKDEIKKEKELKKKNRMILRTDIAGIEIPQKKSDFKNIFHQDPVPQFYTGTCWSFASTSYFESEIFRIKKEKMKLSEMWTVYWTYVEKSLRYIKKRGNSLVAEGDQPNAHLRIFKKYGIVPGKVYTGLIKNRTKHDHRALIKELKSYLKYVKINNLWNEKWNIKHVMLILDKHIGKPPVKFNYKNKEYSPVSFYKYTNLKMDEYIVAISTSKFKFYTKQELEVPDNWWKCKDYINLPLKEWFGIVKSSLNSNYSMVIGGDVSEPGKLPDKNLMIIPTFDIPSSLIDQTSREYRIYNKSTYDDHGVHVVGIKKINKKSWFLIKDSGRSSRYGSSKGYYFMNSDYLKLKILSFLVHKDKIKGIIDKIK